MKHGVMHWSGTLFALVLAAGVAPTVVAQTVEIRQVPTLTPARFPADAREPRTSAVKRVRSTIPSSERVGDLQEGLFCGKKGNLVFNEKMWESVSRPLGRIYREELERAGFPVVKAGDSAFADNTRPAAADLDVGITVRKVAMNMCVKGGNTLVGQSLIELRFEFYAPSARKVVLDLATEGSYQFPDEYKLTRDGLLGDAMRASIRNLLADPRVVEWLAGVQPLPAADLRAELLKVRGEKPTSLPTASNATALRAAVATVQTPTGTGSGFFVSAEGYLLTNQHVVGNNRFVRIKLTTGRELAGEVMKADSDRDVALIKTEAVSFPALAVRAGEANVGEDVFVIGSPLGEAFSSTLTRGVLSGHRRLNDQRYIQSDASILPGSSGGPLLDGSGSVIGMTVKGVRAEVGNMSLFIPIGEVLSRLGVELQP